MEMTIQICNGRYGLATPRTRGQANNMKSKALSNLRWRRLVLKVSGVALTGSDTCNIDPKVCGLVIHIWED
ncbi:hypothetical protein Fmac_026713 [Flemingia macrophylla]|uniref:Uncharacterized protein n=1 Tax=Flemingia macrophylla TaxID=520843 RepID=A0ABD1LFM5_9FABA